MARKTRKPKVRNPIIEITRLYSDTIDHGCIDARNEWWKNRRNRSYRIDANILVKNLVAQHDDMGPTR